MARKFTVLSLFDGIGCAQVAMDRLGWDYDYYYSEIDKGAMKIAAANHAKRTALGDVTQIKYHQEIHRLTSEKGPVDATIDLMIGGSPCQSLSSAAGQKESGLEKGKSVLFWEFVRLLHEVQPKYFLLENVASMKQSDKHAITKALQKVYPETTSIDINSALMTAQSRKRIYWSNIPNIQLPQDNKIYLVDILESGHVDRDKSYCIDANYYKGTNLEHYLKYKCRQIVLEPSEYHNRPKKIGFITHRDKQGYRVYSKTGKSTALKASSCGHGRQTGLYDSKDATIRRLTIKECCRLQGLPDNYCDTDEVSKTAKYRGLGNGFTVPVIQHILSHIKP